MGFSEGLLLSDSRVSKMEPNMTNKTGANKTHPMINN